MWNISTYVSVCLCLCTWVTAAGADAGPDAGAAGQLQCAPPRCRYVGGAGRSSQSEYEFSLDGNKILINYMDGKYLQLDCDGWEALDYSALPYFPSAYRVPAITLKSCPPPAGNRSFAGVLAALNVTMVQTTTQGNLSLVNLPVKPPLNARHFTDLEGLVSLKLTARTRQRPAPDAGFLSALQSLRSLVVVRVRMPAGELSHAPAALRVLTLRDADVKQLPTVLPGLRELVLSEKTLADVVVPPALRTLSLSSLSTTLTLDAMPTLESLTLVNWAEKKPMPMKGCDALQYLQLTSPAVENLPEGWLAACPRLERLVIVGATNLMTLPARLLQGARALTYLRLSSGALESLPPELLDHVPALLTLDLSGNKIRMLPSGFFAAVNALQSLNLSSNKFSAPAHSADGLEALAALSDLTALNLANNPGLGNLCYDSFGYSRMMGMQKLASLNLSKTNITRICRDWRDRLINLKTLDVRYTKISELWFSDLQYVRSKSAEDAQVLLQGAAVASVRYSAEDYAASLSAPPTGATVVLDSLLDCDCHMYWTRRALEHRNNSTLVRSLRCADGPRALGAVSPDELVCRAARDCPAACQCVGRPDGAPAARAALLRVRCERAGLAAVPRLPPPPASVRLVTYDLLLAGNNISELHAADLPLLWRNLDLRNNSIKRIDEETATSLTVGGRGGRLQLAGNPLKCDCGAAPLQLALRSRAAAAAAPRPPDVAAATCADGSALDAAPVAHCTRVPLAAWLVGSLAVLLLATVAVLAYFVPPERRIVIKVLLYRWGLLRRAAESNDGRCFDAFVSFSHEDEKIARELVERLESGDAPYRLCLHYRDWVPGHYIPDQIVHSVRQSRRTVALVSRHFLASEWARAEFREAHAQTLRDVTPRLVVVLLEEPAALPLDTELCHYLNVNTYVQWGDPWFWEKLRLALPTPRPRLDT